VPEIRATGHDALTLSTELLQRARRAHPRAGAWEAADVQWWWRRPRASDDVEQLFWTDDEGPVAGILLTTWGEDAWQCDPLLVPAAGPSLGTVWARALEEIDAQASGRSVEVLVRDDDAELIGLVEASGFVAGPGGGTLWMDAADRPDVKPPAAGFTLVDRSVRAGTPHPMRERNGDAVEERLGQVSLYDPELDLAIESADGSLAAYSLYWFDPVTKVGLVEPVRVEDEYHRRGLATAMLTAGIDRLAARGAQRVKVGFMSEVAATLYQGIGFRKTSSDTTYERRTPAP
jgi:GNAT superfamily N-acetyltransferase